MWTMNPRQRRRGPNNLQKVEPILPQSGPQTAFLKSQADIAIFGGAAGGSKTFSLLMEASRHVRIPNFAAVIFRRTYPEVTAPGGLWPESMQMYPQIGAIPNGSDLSWTFPSGAVVRFGHLQYSTDVLKWLGAQIAMIGFAQLETFSADQFWYMLSRNRSMCGIKPYIRGTANPQPGWLADFISWWIDPVSGYPIPERSGVLRWFVRRNDEIIWGDSPGPLEAEYGTQPKSVTFIGAKLTDNKKLMEADPGYLGNLQALPRIDRERLEKGNWKISNAENEWLPEVFAGIMFDEWPADVMKYQRVMACDPSKGKFDATGDPSAWIMLAVEPTTMMCWVDCDMDARRPVEPLPSNPGMRSIVTDGIDLCRKFHPAGVLIEINGFQAWVSSAMLRRCIAAGLPLAIYEVNHVEPKPTRIVSGLDAILAQRRLRVKNTPGGRMFVQQMMDFRRDQKASAGIHDDGPDAFVSAVDLWNEIFGAADGSTGITVLQG